MGLVYGSTVNLVSTYRGNKDDHLNHATAALVSFPIVGYYAKSNFFHLEQIVFALTIQVF